MNRRADVGHIEIERPAPLDPRLLLASTFNLLVRTRKRLAAQLDVYGLLAETCLVLIAHAPEATPAEALAQSIREEVAAG